MMTKFGLLALALILLWNLFLRPNRGRGGGDDRGRGRSPAPAPAPPAADMAPCPRCGVYKLPGGRCNCSPSSTGSPRASPAGRD